MTPYSPHPYAHTPRGCFKVNSLPQGPYITMTAARPQ